MLSKELYRQKCRLLASKIAFLKLDPTKIPEYIASQRWFMQLFGVTSNGMDISIQKNSAINLFGREWCDECFTEQLIRTKLYERDPESASPNKVRFVRPKACTTSEQGLSQSQSF